MTPRVPSRRRHARMNPQRYYWLRYRHMQRRFRWLARGGKFGQAEFCLEGAWRYEPSTKWEDP